jgi:alcohol dehydrogenase class IV
MTRMHVLPGAFSIPTQVVFGEGISAQAGQMAKDLGATRVFAVTDPGVAKAGILIAALDSVRAAGLALQLFDQAPLDPTLADAQRIGDLARSFGADLVIAAGGGSGLCAGRSAAMAATNGDLRGCTGHEKYTRDPLPVIAIPTTAGSGSEVSKHLTLTDERTGRKTGIDGYTNAPKIALLDPALVQGVPRGVAVASGIDAFLHALEAYLSTRATPLTDAIALDAFERIWRLLPRALDGDAHAKGDMLFASSMANVACGNAGLTLVHAMNGGVTYCFKARGHTPVAYGMIHGALMPPILRFFIPAAGHRFERLAPIVGVPGGDPSAVVERIIAWARACGAPPTLPWGRIPDADIDLIVDETLTRQRPSPRQPTRDEARAIVLEALGAA